MSNKTVFEVVSGKPENGRLERIKHAGVSLLKEDKGFYKLTLNMWPSVDYFVTKNHSNNRYTIFSKIIRSGSEVKFQNPVGYAKVMNDIRTHLLLYFDLPRLSLYMSLFPSK